jgi:hypothetical protein
MLDNRWITDLGAIFSGRYQDTCTSSVPTVPYEHYDVMQGIVGLNFSCALRLLWVYTEPKIILSDSIIKNT